MSESLTIDPPDRLGVALADGEVQLGRHGFSPSMVSMLNPTGAQAEAIRVLRTHIMAQHLGLGRRAVAVCGPTAGVGCSFIASNLAVALSQIGVKTLLVEGDLRNPSIGRLIRPPRAIPGLAECLGATDSPFAASIDVDVLPNFSVIYAGHTTSNPQELLSGERFRLLMNYCLREYDATIVDTPPANKYSDARIISGVLGYALIVTARDKTMVKDVEVLIGQLKADNAVAVGTVLNRA